MIISLSEPEVKGRKGVSFMSNDTDLRWCQDVPSWEHILSYVRQVCGRLASHPVMTQPSVTILR